MMIILKILPIAYDSFGVRSQCTLVVTDDLKILIDPGVALGPRRYGLPPTEPELKALELARKKIIEIGKIADVTIVTHYHYDHHPFPGDEEMYEACFKGKIVIAKDIKNNINYSGKRRGKLFESKVKELSDELIWGDGKSFKFGSVSVKISPAVWHGDVGSRVGRVFMVYLSDGSGDFLFGSDAQSLADPEAMRWFIKMDPSIATLDGYPTIFVGWRMSIKSFEKALSNLGMAIKSTKVFKIILDHHIVRDIDYKDKIKPIIDLASSLNKKILTAAEYYDVKNFFLEAWRKKIKNGEIKVDVESYYKNLFKKLKF